MSGSNKKSSARRVALLSVALLLTTSLPVASSQAETGPANTLVVTPSEHWMPVGDQVQFRAYYYNAQGQLTASDVHWTAEGSCRGGSQFKDTGLFVAEEVNRGTTSCVITAKTKNIAGTATVYFTGSLHRIEITPSSADVPAGGSQTFTARGYDASGASVAITPTWATTCGTSVPDGVLQAPTTVTSCAVTAASGGITAAAAVRVVPASLAGVRFVSAPATTTADVPVTFRAEAHDAYGNPRPDTVAYALERGAGAVDAATGVFTPRLVGRDVVAVSVGGVKHNEAGIDITRGVVGSVRFVDAPAQLLATDTHQFAVELRDGKGNLISDLQPTFSLGTASGSITSSGFFEAREAKPAQILATASEHGVTRTASHTVAIEVGPLASVSFVGVPATLSADDTLQLSAATYDARGNPRSGDPVAFTKLSGDGTLSEAGLFTPSLMGDVQFQAAAGDATATATVRVLAGAPASIVFTSAPAGTDADTSVPFTAVAYDRAGNLIAGFPIVYEVEGSGRFVGGSFVPDKVGTHTIVARAGDAPAARSTIVVSPGALDGIRFVSPPLSLTADETAQLQVETFDANGNLRTGDAVSFRLASGTGDVSATGLFTPDKVGSVSIVAEAGGESATATLVVSVGGAASIGFVDPPAFVSADDVVDLRATSYDANGNPRTDAVTFRLVSGDGLLTPEGRFTPRFAGPVTIEASYGGITAPLTFQVLAGRPASVLFSRAPATTTADVPVTFLAIAYDADGNALPAHPISYSLVDASDARGAVDAASGTFTPRAAGTHTIVATALGGVTGSALITVAPGPLHSLVLTPAGDAAAGTLASVAVQAYDRFGNVIAYTPSVLDVQAPKTVGVHTLVYRDPATGVEGSYSLTVTPGALYRIALAGTAAPRAGEDTTYAIRAYDLHGNRIEALDGALTWRETRAGPTTVVAVHSGLTATLDVVVQPGAVARVSLLTGPVTRSADRRDPLPLAWEARDAHNNLVPTTADQFTWALVPAGGAVLAGSLHQTTVAGVQTLIATHSATGARDSLTVTTLPGELQQAALSPAKAKIAVGQIKAFRPAFADAYGNILPAPPLSWTLTSSRVLTLDPATGAARGEVIGTTTIVVRDLDRRVEARAEVEVLPVDEIVGGATIVAPAPQLAAGDPFVFRVTIVDKDGNAVEGLKPVYVVEKPEHGSISADGIFTGDRAGITDVVARVGSTEARVTITVIPGQLAQIKVSPDSATLALGGSIRFSGEGQDARRNTIPGVPITWSVSNPALGTIAASGLYTAGSQQGVNKVRATAGSIVREAVVYQYITETRAAASTTTVVDAVTTSGRVADIPTTTHVIGLAEVAATARLDLALPPAAPSQANVVREAKVDIERRATNVTIMLEVQPGSSEILPEEIGRRAFEQRLAASEDPEPGLFISVIATEDGERLDSGRLNSLLRSMDVQFSVSASYFEERGLDPTQVRLVEWSNGRLVRADVPAYLLTPTPIGGVYTYAATFFEFSSFAFVARPLAAAPPAAPPVVASPSAVAPSAVYIPPPITRMALAGPEQLVAGTTGWYTVVAWSADGQRVSASKAQVPFRATAAGVAVVEYVEQGVRATKRITVAPSAPETIAADGVPRVYAGSKGGFTIYGVDEFGNRLSLGSHVVEMSATGTQKVLVELDGMMTEIEVEVVPDFLKVIVVEGPAVVVAGSDVVYSLRGFDAHGNAVPLRQDELHVQAPGQAGEMLVFYDEGGIAGSLPVKVVASGLASIKVVGNPVVPADTTSTFALEGYDAFGNRVPLQQDTLAFEGGVGGRQTYVCYAEGGVSGCADVVVEETLEVHRVAAESKAGPSRWLGVGFVLFAMSTVAIFAFIIGRRRRVDDEDEE